MSIMPTDFRAIEARLPALEPWRLHLLRAAERIAVRGHAKKTLCDPDGRVCVVGALLDYRIGSCGEEEQHGEWDHRSFDALEVRIGYCPMSWNNSPRTTAKEVIDTMIEVALAP